MKRLILLGIVALCSMSPAAASGVSVGSDIASDDYNAAIDIVILADGYGASQQAQFQRDARKIVRAVRSESVSAPMRAARTFNFHFIFMASKDTGAPWSPGQAPRRTPFETHVDLEGLIVSDSARADMTAIEHAPDVDIVVVLCHFLAEDDPASEPSRAPESATRRDHVLPVADMPNDGNRIFIASHDTAVFIHELGHALYGLGDEYEDYEGRIPEEQLWELAVVPNLTSEPTGARWQHIVPTAFEGGGYYTQGVYRPQRHCRMREPRSGDFCKVCAHHIHQEPTLTKPTRPRITQPRSGASYSARYDPEKRNYLYELEPRWETPESGAPLFWTVTVLRIGSDGREIYEYEDFPEGHITGRTIPIRLRTPGRFRVLLSATNFRGETSVAARRSFEIKPARSRGMTQALEDGD